jgi:hypothetical protein
MSTKKKTKFKRKSFNGGFECYSVSYNKEAIAAARGWAL